jgi:hypothetical protein
MSPNDGAWFLLPLPHDILMKNKLQGALYEQEKAK